MAFERRDRQRIGIAQSRAFDHPIRLGILGLFTKDRKRSLAADGLLADLIEEDPEEFGGINMAQVHYHCVRLQDAQLLPRPASVNQATEDR